MDKIFSEEFHKLFQRYKSGKNFAFSKYGDGEWEVICNRYLNNGEFWFNQNTPEISRKLLVDSFNYVDSNYYVGLGCPCCIRERAKEMQDSCPSSEENVTFANIFVNSNYKLYKEFFIPEFSKRDIWLVCNRQSKVSNLPFKPEKIFFVDRNAWVNDIELIGEILRLQPNNKSLLFCTGPFGNILSYMLHRNNSNNTYLDIGSTLNPWLESEGFKRDYYTTGQFKDRTCIWKLKNY